MIWWMMDDLWMTMTVTRTKSNSASAYFCPQEVSRDSWAGSVLPKNRTCNYRLGWASLDKTFGRELKWHGQTRKKAGKWSYDFLDSSGFLSESSKTLLLSSSCLPAVKPQAELPQLTVNPTYLHKQGLVVTQMRRLCWNVLGPLQSTHKKMHRFILNMIKWTMILFLRASSLQT